jgi:D-3-phosphoglycerate dehydrogenase
MKPDAVLVNTARGGLIDEEALYRELSDGRLCGYGADVHTKEPPDFLPLLRLDNVVTTPHMAGVSKQALINMSTGSARKVIQYLVKKEIPADVLNPDVLDQ